ncbi:Transmembrane amino acid transporter family protein [Rhynchospora pubera]|uniref:Transmembrane amino acid transporter family protein n=1 Tax=Rhynchospora pubera TaxID=906938 RepID=A0AAV8E0V0_9POAL|nr:Transmembrane amino acid transporter family protein [Rhynchospora pubera]
MQMEKFHMAFDDLTGGKNCCAIVQAIRSMLRLRPESLEERQRRENVQEVELDQLLDMLADEDDLYLSFHFLFARMEPSYVECKIFKYDKVKGKWKERPERSWIHCGYHLTTAIVATALLSLPLAFASIGWTAGVVCLVLGTVVSFYSYNLISHVLEHHAQIGRRQLRFRDMANDLLGRSGWGRYYVGPIQFAVCFGTVVGSILLAGQSLKAIYLIAYPDGTIKLYVFIIIFGALSLVLAQMPSFHSLRHVNLVSLVLCLIYSLCATVGSIYAGHSNKAPSRDYSILGSSTQHTFGVFNAISIIAATFGNGIGTGHSETSRKAPSSATSWSTATISFPCGSFTSPTFSPSFSSLPLLPCTCNPQMICWNADATKGQFSARNVIPRILLRSAAIATATTFAAMLPFFGDINAILGAFGFLPLDFVLPSIFYNITFKPSRHSLVFWINTLLIGVFATLTLLGSISAVRQIVLDAKNYKLFANV